MSELLEQVEISTKVKTYKVICNECSGTGYYIFQNEPCSNCSGEGSYESEL